MSLGVTSVFETSLHKLGKEIYPIKAAASTALLNHILLISSIQRQEGLVNPIWQVEIIITKLYLNVNEFYTSLKGKSSKEQS